MFLPLGFFRVYALGFRVFRGILKNALQKNEAKSIHYHGLRFFSLTKVDN